MKQPARLFFFVGPWLGVAAALALALIQRGELAEQAEALEALRRSPSAATPSAEAPDTKAIGARFAALEARLDALESAARRQAPSATDGGDTKATGAAHEPGLADELATLRAEVTALRAQSPWRAGADPIERALGPIAPIANGLGLMGGQGPLANVQKLAQAQADQGRLEQLDASVSLSDEEREAIAQALEAWRARQREVSRRLTSGDLARDDARDELEASRADVRVALERILGPERFERAAATFANLRPR